MITKDTAFQIAVCYNEIEATEKLIADIKELVDTSKKPEHWKDGFGRPRGIEMGIPSGQDSRRVFHVSPSSALLILTDHLETMRTNLKTLDQKARGEADFH